MKISHILLMVLLSSQTQACDLISRLGFEAGDDLPWLTDPTGTPSARHTAHTIGSTDANQGYYEYLPQGYECGGQDYPLIVFIHGLGENGDGDSQLDDVLDNGIPKLIDNNSWDEERPFVVLSPQNSNGGCTSSTDIQNFINYAKTAYRINPRRVYLTGLSCGGIGSWNYLGNHTNTQIAAVVPIAGNGNGAFNNGGCEMNRVPIWAFHGDNDGTVDVSGTTGPINNLLACTDPAPIDTSMVIYPGVGHDSWTRTYDLNNVNSEGYNIYQWFLSKVNNNVVIPNEFEVGRSLAVDFGGTDSISALPWNNITNVNGASNNLLDDLSINTTINISITDGFNGSNQGGIAANGIGYPGTVSVDNMWLGSFDGHAAGLLESATVVISGLDETATYDLELFASRTGNDGGLGRLTRYTIGGDHQDLEASDNTINTVSFNGLSGNNQIELHITVSPDGTGRFAYLNAFILSRVD
ncbi:hypothetical protein [Marinicella rhabdoformis]|uniref:carboxylesterase family protein n=1 Tax=Marinicella rhabdoformis TaxID=2580566 RepID=UPI0012AEDB70|nr:hypothetical protein [Marinicella rhabdoformis]